jgi:hypothetical protein
LRFLQFFCEIGDFQVSGGFQVLREGQFFEEITKKSRN